LAYFAFPALHRVKLHSINPWERLNKEMKRRANGVGIFPNEASLLRLIGAVLMEQNEEWQLQHRSMPQHTMVDATTEVMPPIPLTG
jgi:transposase-like protein